MKKIPFFLFFVLFVVFASAQAQTKLIVRADDMGSSHASNQSCLQTFKSGIATTFEVMAITPWFPEAVRILKENPEMEVGLHLALTSEWDNIKWRPLTACNGLKDKNGYFYPKIFPDPNYPGQAITENPWTLKEIENEFRAQIELALRNIPQISHLSGHMGATGFDKSVAEMTLRLSREYNLPLVDGNSETDFNIINFGYQGLNTSASEKETSFIAMLNKLETGKTYCFLDHPGFDNSEMQAIHHIKYENVATDRQGVTDIFTNEKIKNTIREKNITLIGYNDAIKALPRAIQKGAGFQKNMQMYFDEVKSSGQELHSIMIVQHGKVLHETWLGDQAPDKKHVMWSVSKSFTSAAIGFAVAENRIKVTDKVISFFPDQLPVQVSENLKKMEIRHLLTMSTGHEIDPTGISDSSGNTWVQKFFEAPIVSEPGTHFVYNSLATYMLSAILNKVTGESMMDYLYPRLFRPLGITGAEWLNSPQGIAIGGWGLLVKTEDMAKFGQFMLQKGKWNNQQLLPESWFDEATKAHIKQGPSWVPKKTKAKDSDWLQGYGYQLWRCRNNAFRADGMNGQFIIVLPEKDAVIVTTAHIPEMQSEINLIWKYILPLL